jgi:hypothetical protein
LNHELVRRTKPFEAQTLVAERAVEALGDAILPRLAGFDQYRAEELARWPLGSILVNRLISPVCRVGEHVRPVASHLVVVAIFAGVSEEDAAGMVLCRLWLA